LPKGKSAVSLDTNLIHYRQLLVTGTTRQSLRHFQKTLDLITEGVLRVGELVTSSQPLSEIKTAITNASNGTGLKSRIVFAE